MTGSRRAVVAITSLVAGTALLLTGCTHDAGARPGTSQSVSGPDDAQLKDMQDKLDAAESAAAQADEDATQNN